MPSALPPCVELIEVGPREGFQFEGMVDPDRIPTHRKVELATALAQTGLRTIQVVSFVSPKVVPQMADAEAVCAALPRVDGVEFTGIYLNDSGLARALAVSGLVIKAELLLSASEGFALRNQRRTFADELAMQRTMAAAYRHAGIAIDTANIMAAFGSNMEGDIPVATVLEKIGALIDIAAEAGGALTHVNLADTMGWANPALVHRLVDAVRSAWPHVRIGLHLHDTRGLAIANVFAALEAGVDRFDTGLGGLGGCPFAGNRGAAGNVATEEVVFLCRELGIETGVDLDALVACAHLAADIVGHPLPSKLLTASLHRPD
jgi:hydroxymethylglutaryl-CoA lyase